MEWAFFFFSSSSSPKYARVVNKYRVCMGRWSISCKLWCWQDSLEMIPTFWGDIYIYFTFKWKFINRMLNLKKSKISFLELLPPLRVCPGMNHLKVQFNIQGPWRAEVWRLFLDINTTRRKLLGGNIIELPTFWLDFSKGEASQSFNTRLAKYSLPSVSWCLQLTDMSVVC